MFSNERQRGACNGTESLQDPSHNPRIEAARRVLRHHFEDTEAKMVNRAEEFVVRRDRANLLQPTEGCTLAIVGNCQTTGEFLDGISHHSLR